MKTYIYNIKWNNSLVTYSAETKQSVRTSLAEKHRLPLEAIQVWEMQERWKPSEDWPDYFFEDQKPKQEKKQ